MNNKLCEENDQNSLTTKLLYEMWELAVLFGRWGLGWCYGSFHLCTKRVRWHTKLPVCDPRQQVPRSNWTQHVNSSSLWVHCEPPRWMIGIQVFRTDWALTVLVSLQLTQSWRWRAWPLNASCNSVNLLQVSSVQFSSVRALWTVP